MNCIQVQLSMVPTKEETNPLPSQPCPTRVSLVRPRFGGLPPRGWLGGGGVVSFFSFRCFSALLFPSAVPPSRPLPPRKTNTQQWGVSTIATRCWFLMS